jgi:uncharacterized membrane protein YbhN (UPF0104 family)
MTPWTRPTFTQESYQVKQKSFWNAFKYLLAVSLLTYVVWSNWEPKNGHGLAEIWQKHVIEGRPIHYIYLLLAFLIGLASVLITFVRWYFLVRAVELPFRVVDALRLGFVGFFFNTFLPGSVGGDIIKAAGIARGQSRRTVAVATVIMDRAIALWALIWFVAILGGGFWLAGILEGPGADQSQTIVKMACAIVAVSMVVWMLLGLLPPQRAEIFARRLHRLPKVGGSAAEFWRAVWMYRCRPRSVFGALALAWVGHVGFVFTFYFSALTLWDADSGLTIPTLAQHFLIVPIGLVIQAMPLFPGGAGIGELGFGLLYDWFDCSKSSGVVGTLVQRVINWVLGGLGYIVYLQMRPSTHTPTAVEATGQKQMVETDDAPGL